MIIVTGFYFGPQDLNLTFGLVAQVCQFGITITFTLELHFLVISMNPAHKSPCANLYNMYAAALRDFTTVW